MFDESIEYLVVGTTVCIQVRDESGWLVEDSTVDEPSDKNDVACVVDGCSVAFVAFLPEMPREWCKVIGTTPDAITAPTGLGYDLEVESVRDCVLAKESGFEWIEPPTLFCVAAGVG